MNVCLDRVVELIWTSNGLCILDRASISGGGAKALGGAIVLDNMLIARNIAPTAGAFEVSKGDDDFGVPTALVVKVWLPLFSDVRGEHLGTLTACLSGVRCH